MSQSNPQPDRKRDRAEVGAILDKMLFDPRHGDAEDDGSSPKQRSLLAIAGSLFAEISLPKLAFSWTVSILLPAILLGSAPLIATIWFAKASRSVAELTGLGTALMLAAVVGLGWIGWHPLWRIAEVNFWSLNALALQPGYTFCREALRYLAEHMFSRTSNAAARGRLRAVSSAGAAVILCVCSLLIAILAWPATHWIGTVVDLLSLHSFVLPALANAVVVVSAYLAIASLATRAWTSRSTSPHSRPHPPDRRGASRIFQTFTWWASTMDSVSKVDGAALAATVASCALWTASKHSITSGRSISFSSAAT
jgi:hypothetical protein